MLLVFEIFGRARNHGKKHLKLCKTSFSGVVNFCTSSAKFKTLAIFKTPTSQANKNEKLQMISQNLSQLIANLQIFHV